MKKKLLSVLMAGALVATSSVNAFASVQNITGTEERAHDAQVTITGDIANEQGQTQPGTLNVTVPTAANFLVSQAGEFTGTNIEVINNGTQDIDVYAYEFIDTNSSNGINVVKKSELSNQNRSHVSLKLMGSHGTAYFTSTVTGSQKGVFEDEACTTTGDASGVKVANIATGQRYSLQLQGDAGKNTDTEVTTALKDTFTLKLRIAKATNK